VILAEAGVSAAKIEALLQSGATIDGALAASPEAVPSGRIARKSPMA
jgi:hypothetical protein